MHWIKAAAVLGIAIGATGRAQSPSPSMPQLPAPSAPSVQPRYVVVLDAAHGGDDTGTRLQGGTIEKDITLSLAIRLRSLLGARGIQVVTTREGDVNLPALSRAQAANHAQSAACVVIHATATGSGVHLFTSSLAQAPEERVLPWATAQAAYVTQSMKLESEFDSALAHARIPVTLGRASVEPMDNLACPAVAVEVAPLVGGHITSARALTDPGYESAVLGALAAALEQWRSDWKQ